MIHHMLQNYINISPKYHAPKNEASLHLHISKKNNNNFAMRLHTAMTTAVTTDYYYC